MKILHIIDSLNYGGAQSLLSDLVVVQKGQGHEVAVLCLVAREIGFTEKISEFGIDIINVSKGSVYNPLLIFKIIPYLKTYDVIHSHLFPANYWTGFAKLLSRIKVTLITTEHSTTNKRRNHHLLKYVDRYMYNNLYDCTACCSDKALETFQKAFPKANAISIPNGINVDRYKTAEPLDMKTIAGDKDAFVVTMVARFQPPKRQDMLIEALRWLPDNVHIVLVGGDGNQGQLDACKNLAKELGYAKHVHFLGFRNDVPSILKGSDIVVLASEYEGLSLSSVEGMSVGHPFIASNVNGLREVVDGAGLLFEIGDNEGLANLISLMLKNKAEREKIANLCVKRAEMYDIKVMASAYHDLYKQYCKK